MSWEKDLELAIDDAVQRLERRLRDRISFMARAAYRPLADWETRQIAKPFAAAIASAIKRHAEEMS